MSDKPVVPGLTNQDWKDDVEAALRTLNRVLARLPKDMELHAADAFGRRVRSKRRRRSGTSPAK